MSDGDKSLPLWERLRFLVKERRHVQIGVVEEELIAAAAGLEYASLRLKEAVRSHVATPACDCKSYNGGPCYNCINGAHHICDSGKRVCPAAQSSTRAKVDAWTLYCAAFHALNGEKAKVELSPAALQEMVDAIIETPTFAASARATPEFPCRRCDNTGRINVQYTICPDCDEARVAADGSHHG